MFAYVIPEIFILSETVRKNLARRNLKCRETFICL